MRYPESGLSLIELMIGLAITGVLVWQYSSYQFREERKAMFQEAESDSRHQLESVLNLIRKNMKTRLASSVPEVKANRLSFRQEMADGRQLSMTIISQCRQSNGKPLQVKGRSPADLECWRSLACEGVPFLEVTMEGIEATTRTTHIPDALVWEKQSLKASGFVGLALCFAQASDHIDVYGLKVIQTRDTHGATFLSLEGLQSHVLTERRNTIDFLR